MALASARVQDTLQNTQLVVVGGGWNSGRNLIHAISGERTNVGCWEELCSHEHMLVTSTNRMVRREGKEKKEKEGERKKKNAPNCYCRP